MTYGRVRRVAAGLSCAFAVGLGNCHGGGIPSGPQLPQTRSNASIRVSTASHLGGVLTTRDGGQIYGFDVNQFGDDGALASSATTNRPGVYTVSVETFDQRTGAITSSFANETGSVNSYAFDGIFPGDVGLVTHYIVPPGQIYARRVYALMNPVTAGRFSGPWSPGASDDDISMASRSWLGSVSALFAEHLKSDAIDLIVADLGGSTAPTTLHLDQGTFQGAKGPKQAYYLLGNSAVFALSPSFGAAGGSAPVTILVDLRTGALHQLTGFNNGYYGAGYVNGVAVDPTTGIAATDTELNAEVEFYDMKKLRPIVAVQLPCTTNVDQTLSGAGIANDPVHKLFLVAEPSYGCEPQTGALVIYDENGNQVDTIVGFHMALAEPPVAVNPRSRVGWAFGPKFSQLQQFFY